MVLPYEDVRLRKELLGKVVDVSFRIDHFLDPSVDEDLGSHRTRICGGVDRTVLHAHSEVCRLDYGVLFGVDASAQFMPCTRGNLHLLPDASQRLAVLRSLR